MQTSLNYVYITVAFSGRMYLLIYRLIDPHSNMSLISRFINLLWILCYM